MNQSERITLEVKLERAMRAYYRHYYKEQLGLVDWEARIENRLEEEHIFAEPQIARVEDWLGISFKGLKVLVVGAGTGAELVVFHKRGAEVHAVEPDPDGHSILQLKAKLHGISSGRVHDAAAEEIPYDDNSFDFVYCYTVLEHVRDVEKSVGEMIRVCKIGGMIFIHTPDYRFPYELHYKSDRIPFSPRWLTLIQFWLQGKPVKFLRTVNFLTAPELDKIFLRFDVVTLRVFQPLIRNWSVNSRSKWLKSWFLKNFGIVRDQNIFLKKTAPFDKSSGL